MDIGEAVRPTFVTAGRERDRVVRVTDAGVGYRIPSPESDNIAAQRLEPGENRFELDGIFLWLQ